FVEARAADHAIGQAEGDEAVFELAHLERGAHQDGDLVEHMALALQLFDLLADRAGFLLAVPGAGDRDLLAELVLGAQRLAEPAFVVGDEMRGAGQDVPGRAVVSFEADDLGAGEVVLEAQDVVHFGAAPAIDRLVVIADAADIFRAAGQGLLRGGRRRGRVAERITKIDTFGLILRDARALPSLLRMRIKACVARKAALGPRRDATFNLILRSRA